MILELEMMSDNRNSEDIEADGEFGYKKYKCIDANFAPVVQAVINFRKMIDEAKGVTLKNDGIFSRFPKGCCSDTARLLWKYIQRLFGGRYDNDIMYYEGIKGNKTHAWLEYKNEIIIDITADQFSDLKDCPVVISKDRSFYDMFVIVGKSPKEADFEKMADLYRERLRKVYALICQ